MTFEEWLDVTRPYIDGIYEHLQRYGHFESAVIASIFSFLNTQESNNQSDGLSIAETVFGIAILNGVGLIHSLYLRGQLNDRLNSIRVHAHSNDNQRMRAERYSVQLTDSTKYFLTGTAVSTSTLTALIVRNHAEWNPVMYASQALVQEYFNRNVREISDWCESNETTLSALVEAERTATALSVAMDTRTESPTLVDETQFRSLIDSLSLVASSTEGSQPDLRLGPGSEDSSASGGDASLGADEKEQDAQHAVGNKRGGVLGAREDLSLSSRDSSASSSSGKGRPASAAESLGADSAGGSAQAKSEGTSTGSRESDSQADDVSLSSSGKPGAVDEQPQRAHVFRGVRGSAAPPSAGSKHVDDGYDDDSVKGHSKTL